MEGYFCLWELVWYDVVKFGLARENHDLYPRLMAMFLKNVICMLSCE
jgi:hypothetical protein